MIGSLGIFCRHFIDIFVESAPWLLFGFAITGVIKAFISTDLLQRHLGGNTVGAVLKGAIFGAPMPLCSCGVIPAALGLHRAGASKPATTAFLIATPETGVDSVSVTYALLGPFMAIVRPVAAVTTAILSGLAVMFFEGNEVQPSKQADVLATSSCCSSKAKPAEPKSDCCSSTSESKKALEATEETSSCCASKKPELNQETAPSLLSKLADGLKFSFVDLLKDISLWLLIGLAMAALIMTFVPAAFLAKWGASPYAYLMMALIGVPMYICATSSTPIAAGLLFAGVSPGAILVFLLVGPATNIATLSMVKNELGVRTLVIYLSVIIGVGFLFGAIVDELAGQFGINVSEHAAHSHGSHASSLAIASAALLAVLIARALWQKYRPEIPNSESSL